MSKQKRSSSSRDKREKSRHQKRKRVEAEDEKEDIEQLVEERNARARRSTSHEHSSSFSSSSSYSSSSSSYSSNSISSSSSISSNDDSDGNDDHSHRRHRRRNRSRSSDKKKRKQHSSSSHSKSRKRNKKKSHHKKHKNDKKKKKKNKHYKDKEERSRRKRERRSKYYDDESEGSENTSTYNNKKKNRTSVLLHSVVEKIYVLLRSYPDIKPQLIMMLQKMCGDGTSFSLHQMTDANVARMLEDVFAALEPFGVHYHCDGKDLDKKEWMWKSNNDNNNNNNQSKSNETHYLLRIIKSAFDHVGLTMEAIIHQQNNNSDEKKNKTTSNSNYKATAQEEEEDSKKDFKIMKVESEIVSFTKMLISKFAPLSSSENSTQEERKSSFANELLELCSEILEEDREIKKMKSDANDEASEEESPFLLSIDEIPNMELRMGLHLLFTKAGLEYMEMENNEDDDDENMKDEKDQEEKSMGFGLPTTNHSNKNNESDESQQLLISQAKENLEAILKTCSSWIDSPPAPIEKQKKVIKGPSLPPPSALQYHQLHEENNEKNTMLCDEETDSDEDELGPTLPSTTSTATTKRISNSRVKELANQRKAILENAIKGNQNGAQNNQNTTTTDGDKKMKREEWILSAGSHSFINEIMKNPMKQRTFRNVKSSTTTSTSQDNQSQPSSRMQKEMGEMIQQYKEARGPSLIDQHLSERKEKSESAKHSSSSSWKWSRDKDLDKDRKVDKNALNQILGGASKGLTDKFQGGISKSFM